MTITETEAAPETSGAAPGPGRLKRAGTDGRCSWILWGAEGSGRCPEYATDTVKGKLYCSPHADRAADI